MKAYKLLPLLVFTLVFMGSSCLGLGGGGDELVFSGPGGMFTSPDKGETWAPISLLPRADGVKNINGQSVFRLKEDPNDPKAFYWQTRGAGFVFTYNKGESWQQPAAPLNTGFIYDVTVHPKDPCTIYATNGKDLHRSTDCNRSWEKLYSNIQSDTIRSIAINPFRPEEVYMMTTRNVHFSNDGGISWQLVQDSASPADLERIMYDNTIEGRMYITRKSAGLYRSDNNGQNWVKVLDGLEEEYEGIFTYRRFVVHPTVPDTIFWISKYGIHYSTDAGENWAAFDLVTNPGAAQIYAFAINPKNDQEIYYTATVRDQSALYMSTDGGRTWITKNLPSRQIPTALEIDTEDENTLYLGYTIYTPSS